MDKSILKEIFSRDLHRLKTEVLSYRSEAALWKAEKEIKNAAGNLCLHIVGNLNTYIGAVLGDTGYVRQREQEFQLKGLPRTEVVNKIEEATAVVQATLDRLTPAQMEAEYPVIVFDTKTTTGFMLVHLASHLGYHLGQVNYHRRLLDE